MPEGFLACSTYRKIQVTSIENRLQSIIQDRVPQFVMKINCPGNFYENKLPIPVGFYKNILSTPVGFFLNKKPTLVGFYKNKLPTPMGFYGK